MNLRSTIQAESEIRRKDWIRSKLERSFRFTLCRKVWSATPAWTKFFQIQKLSRPSRRIVVQILRAITGGTLRRVSGKRSAALSTSLFIARSWSFLILSVDGAWSAFVFKGRRWSHGVARRCLTTVSVNIWPDSGSYEPISKMKDDWLR